MTVKELRLSASLTNYIYFYERILVLIFLENRFTHFNGALITVLFTIFKWI